MSTAANNVNQRIEENNNLQQQQQQQHEIPARGGTASMSGVEVRGGGAGLAGFAFRSMDDAVNGIDASGVQRTPRRGLANSTPGWQAQPQQSVGSINRMPGHLPNRNRFQTYPGGQAQAERASLNGSGTGGGHFRRDSEGSTSDSANEVENMLGGQVRQIQRVPLNQAASTTGRLQSSSTFNRQGQRGFSFGQNTSRGKKFLVENRKVSDIYRSEAPSSEQRRSGTFRPAGFSR